MKTWENELTKAESLFGSHKIRSWKTILERMQAFMNQYPNDVELNIRVIYLLHNILVEEEYPDDELAPMMELLIKYFRETYQRFSEDAEYLFFIGKILYVAEWYFGLNDDDKPIEERLAFQMQKKAIEKEPDNKLYKWAYFLSKGSEEKSFLLAQEILNGNSIYLNWLKTKGFPGKYIISILKSS